MATTRKEKVAVVSWSALLAARLEMTQQSSLAPADPVLLLSSVPPRPRSSSPSWTTIALQRGERRELKLQFTRSVNSQSYRPSKLSRVELEEENCTYEMLLLISTTMFPKSPACLD